ncbi:MAG: 30S ribosome-binding factor RbfA [Thermoanaerobaculales bacterium]|nr:30S ribosome-binding factor RbfA [Thermoanaerobaculales bacterium]
MSRKGFSRNQRLEGEIRSVLAETLLQDVKDPRLEGVIVSTVRLNRDGTLATIFFSLIGDSEKERQAADGFAAASPFLRRTLGRRMRIRILPSLEFARDESFEYGAKLDRLFDKLHSEGVIPPTEEDPGAES